MNDTPIDLKLRQGMKVYANYIAMVVQNTLEEYEKNNTSEDEQQSEEKDQLLRNAIYTALYSYEY